MSSCLSSTVIVCLARLSTISAIGQWLSLVYPNVSTVDGFDAITFKQVGTGFVYYIRFIVQRFLQQKLRHGKSDKHQYVTGKEYRGVWDIKQTTAIRLKVYWS